MSEILWERPDLKVSKYVGPEIGWSDPAVPLSASRQRYQITTGEGRVFTLSALEWDALRAFFQGEPS